MNNKLGWFIEKKSFLVLKFLPTILTNANGKLIYSGAKFQSSQLKVKNFFDVAREQKKHDTISTNDCWKLCSSRTFFSFLFCFIKSRLKCDPGKRKEHVTHQSALVLRTSLKGFRVKNEKPLKVFRVAFEHFRHG